MSEVGLEKVITEINSYRQRLTLLREELTRANRAMAEKMAQLGETLTQRVRDLRDQVTNTPQNLLALESQYATGDIEEPAYKAQREEFRTQLTKNLRNIDEIRSLLMIMSQLEARPINQMSPSQGPVPRPVSSAN